MSLPIRFISDIHLSVNRPQLTQLFFKYLNTHARQGKALYILGDLFDAWIGDDAIGEFECEVATRLAMLAESGVKIYFLPGNRDFLLGKSYAKKAHMSLLPDHYVLNYNKERILLTHGDSLCSLDKAHQIFRLISQNFIAKYLFLRIPIGLRISMANKLRSHSTTSNRQKDKKIMDVVGKTLVKKMRHTHCTTVIHGHTHQPQINSWTDAKKPLRQIVLSDWHAEMTDLCYYNTNRYQLNFYKGE